MKWGEAPPSFIGPLSLLKTHFPSQPLKITLSKIALPLGFSTCNAKNTNKYHSIAFVFYILK
jgi:hypothetical protein